MKSGKCTLIIGLLILLSSFKGEDSGKSTMMLNVEGIKSVEGNLGILVFNEKSGFPEEAKKAILELEVQVTDTSMRVSLGQLPEGNYAIALVHDKNANRTLDKNILGIPKEPFGFSNTSSVFFGPPSFDQAVVFFSKQQKEASVRLLEI